MYPASPSSWLFVSIAILATMYMRSDPSMGLITKIQHHLPLRYMMRLNSGFFFSFLITSLDINMAFKGTFSNLTIKRSVCDNVKPSPAAIEIYRYCFYFQGFVKLYSKLKFSFFIDIAFALKCE